MTQTKNNRIQRLYTMNSLPVSWRIDSDLDAGTAYINEHFAGEMASPFWGIKNVMIDIGR